MSDDNNPQSRWTLIIGIIGIVVGIIGVGVAVIEVNQGNVWHGFAYEIVSISSVVSVQDTINDVGQLQILLDGEEINELVSFTIRFRNTGNQPIRAEDYEGPPLRVLFADGRIIRVTATQATDTELLQQINERLSWQNEEMPAIILPEELLNPGDSYTINAFIADTSQEAFDVRGRIANISKIEQYVEVEDIGLIPSR